MDLTHAAFHKLSVRVSKAIISLENFCNKLGGCISYLLCVECIAVFLVL